MKIVSSEQPKCLGDLEASCHCMLCPCGIHTRHRMIEGVCSAAYDAGEDDSGIPL